MTKHDARPARPGTEPTMTSDTIALIRASFRLAAADPQALSRVFFRRLLLRSPGAQRLFPAALVRDPTRLVGLIDQVLRLLHRRDMLVEGLQNLGRLQAHYAALPMHYPAIAGAFREALAIRVGTLWSADMEESWSELQALVIRIMGAAHLAEYQRLAAV
jgi:hemoglobin-like flavoprotein